MKKPTRNALIILAAAVLAVAAWAGTIVTVMITTAATATSSALENPQSDKTYQASGSVGTTTGTATVLIQGSNNGTNWDTLGTISLALTTTTVSGGLSTTDRYAYSRAAVTLAGTTPTLTVTRSY